MDQKHRLIFLLLCLVALIAVGYAVTNSFDFITSDFWFVAGLLMLVLLSVIDQPFFSNDANIFVNGVAGLVSLATVLPAKRSSIWFVFASWTLYLIIASYILMFVRSRELSKESTAVQLVSRVNRQLGRPEALFSAFFLWGVFTQFSSNSGAYTSLLLYWSVFMIINIPEVSRAISSTLRRRRMPQTAETGTILGFVSPRVLECQMHADHPVLLPGVVLHVFALSGEHVATASVIEDRVLLGQRRLHAAISSTTDHWPRISDERVHGKPIEIRVLDEADAKADCPVGSVGQGTTIGSLRLLSNPLQDLEKGEVLRIQLQDGRDGYYQVVEGYVKDRHLESINSALQYVEVSAGQLGIWHSERCRFEPVNWVPPAGGLVFKVQDKGDYDIPPTSIKVGDVPNAPFPVHVHLEDLVTHNTAVIGVTGSGKTYLALHIIEAVADAGVRVLVLDISRQHYIFLQRLDPYQIRKTEDIGDWLGGDKSLAIHQFADANNYTKRTSDLTQAVFAYLEENTQLRAGENEPARIMVVLEEAHSLVPEWNQVSQKNDTNNVNRTARTILQGRKYGLGCLLISQRTANVTKTILNQCNTMFALQSFDQTGLDFLKNYMGEEYAHAISTLPARHAILVGKASSSNRPILFEVTDFGGRWGEG